MILFLADMMTETVEAQSYNYWGDFVNMLMMLGVILVLIFVSVFALKKLMRSRMQQLNKSTGIKIVERRNLNSKASLYVVEILGKSVVISESPACIHLVTELPEEKDA